MRRAAAPNRQGRPEKSDRLLPFRPFRSGWYVVALQGTLKIIQFGQSAVAGVDAEFDVPRFEFACLVYGLLAGQIIDRKDVRLFAEFYGIAHCPCRVPFLGGHASFLHEPNFDGEVGILHRPLYSRCGRIGPVFSAATAARSAASAARFAASEAERAISTWSEARR